MLNAVVNPGAVVQLSAMLLQHNLGRPLGVQQQICKDLFIIAVPLRPQLGCFGREMGVLGETYCSKATPSQLKIWGLIYILV